MTSRAPSHPETPGTPTLVAPPDPMEPPRISRHPIPARRTPAILLACCLATGCGGGSSSGGHQTANGAGGIGSGGTGSYTTGSISGFGSIIVNGVRYDERAAEVTSLDGDTSVDFELGMVVAIEGSEVSTGTADDAQASTATAERIRVGSELIGPVGPTVDVVAGTFTVLGQTVHATTDTFYDALNPHKLNGLGVPGCQYVSVHGFLRSATQGHGDNATRVQCLPGKPATYRARGLVTRVDSTSMDVGGVRFLLGSGVPAPFLNTVVRAEVSTASDTAPWTITRWLTDSAVPTSAADARAEGHVGNYDAATGEFKINGQPALIDATTVFQGLTGLSDNLKVQVRGSVSHGVLKVKTVTLETQSADDFSAAPGNSAGQAQGNRPIELHGTGAQLANLDTTAKTFTFRGVKVSYDPSLNAGQVESALLAAQGRAASKINVHGRRAGEGSSVMAVSIQVRP